MTCGLREELPEAFSLALRNPLPVDQRRQAQRTFGGLVREFFRLSGKTSAQTV